MKQTHAISIAGYTGLLVTVALLPWFLREVDISLTYYWQQSVPLPFRESLQSVGGISALFGDRFLELMARPLSGIMGVALLAGLVFFSLQILLRHHRAQSLWFPLLLAGLIPFILLFAHYRLPVGLIMGIVAGLMLAALQSLYSPRGLVTGTFYNLLTGVIIYLLAGAAGLLVLIQAAIIRAVRLKRFSALVPLLPLLAVPLLYLPLNLTITVKQAYLGCFLIPEYNEIPVVFYLSVFSLLPLFLILKVQELLLPRLAQKRPLLLTAAGVMVVIAALVLSTRDSINDLERTILSVAQAGSQKEWKEVLRLATGQRFINNVVQFDINRALYHSGQLLEGLFKYPQQYGEKGLFLEGSMASSTAIPMCEFYCDLGFVNETRHWAAEAQVGFMRHPIVLKHLVISYLALSHEEAAEKYLRILSRSRLDREWCSQVRERIENGTVREDPAIRAFLINNPESDFFAETANPTRKLLGFFGNNPDNHMVFEYLVASYLLQHNVGNVVLYLPGFRNFGYETLPRSVEEAMLIYLARTKEKLVSLAGYRISPQAREDFIDFSRLVAGTSREEGMEKASKYRNTYWYYVLYTSPHATKE
jgi:hypothetical protein